MNIIILFIFIIIIIFVIYLLNYNLIFLGAIYDSIVLNKSFYNKIDLINNIKIINNKGRYYNPSLKIVNDKIYLFERCNKLNFSIINNTYLFLTSFKEESDIYNPYYSMRIIDINNSNNILENINNSKIILLENYKVSILNSLNKNLKNYSTFKSIIEDIRIIKIVDDIIYISYSYFIYNLYKIGIGYINNKTNIIIHINVIDKDNDIIIKDDQKNWQVINNYNNNIKLILDKYNFDYENNLLMLTYASPIWSISIINIEKGNKKNIPEFYFNLGDKLKDIKWNNISLSGKEPIMSNIRCSTSFEIFNEKYYLTCLHTYRPYLTIFCFVNLNTLIPEYISKPIKFDNKNCIEYTISLNIVNDIIYLGVGIDDISSRIITIYKDVIFDEIVNNGYYLL